MVTSNVLRAFSLFAVESNTLSACVVVTFMVVANGASKLKFLPPTSFESIVSVRVVALSAFIVPVPEIIPFRLTSSFVALAAVTLTSLLSVSISLV